MPADVLPASTPPGSAPSKSTPPPIAPDLQVAHVLFMDMIGYSRLQIDLQRSLIGELQAIVCATQEYTRANAQSALICRPTGDGMALVFLNDMLAPLRCAIEIATALRDLPRIKIRMGVHSGPLYIVQDINGSRDVHGDGIIMAQRVMDCGDDGHILLSGELAAMIGKVKPWSLYLTDVGECGIKHGQTIPLFSLTSRTPGKEFGNPRAPRKVMTHRTSTPPLVHLTAARSVEPENGQRALIYFTLFLMLFGTVGAAGWVTSSGFRTLCRAAFAFPAAASPAIKATGQDTENTAANVLTRDTQSDIAVTPQREAPSQPPPKSVPKSQPRNTRDKGSKGIHIAAHPLPPPQTTLPLPTAAPTGDEENVWHSFKTIAHVPKDGHGERILHVTYKFKDQVREADSEPLGEEGQLQLACEFQGATLTVRIEYGSGAVYQQDFVTAPDSIELEAKP